MEMLHQHPKYLVHVGVFSALYIVLFLATAAMGIFGPPFLFLGWLVGTVLNGTVLMLFRLRAPVFGAMTALAFIQGGIALGSGYPWFVVPGATVLGFIADVVAANGKYTNRTLNAIGYAIFAPWIALPFVSIIFDRQGYFDALYAKARNKAFVGQLEEFLHPQTLFLWITIVAVVGLAGAFLGNRIVNKHFVKSGMVQ